MEAAKSEDERQPPRPRSRPQKVNSRHGKAIANAILRFEGVSVKLNHLCLGVDHGASMTRVSAREYLLGSTTTTILQRRFEITLALLK